MAITKRQWPTFEKVQCFVIVFVLTPGFFFFEMFKVRPALLSFFSMGILQHILHVLLSIFFYINVAGNLFLSLITDTAARRGHLEGDFCDICKFNRSPGAWHCRICNVCIERRDHHCFFLSRCIGLNNMRYYLLFLVHLAVSMIYATYYNYFFASKDFDTHGFMLSVGRAVNPMTRIIVVTDPFAEKDLYVVFWLSNIGLFIWSAGLACYHIKNVIRGVTWFEAEKNKKFYKNRKLRDEMWRQNLQKVFGIKWYWAIIWPLAESPLLEVHSKAS